MRTETFIVYNRDTNQRLTIKGQTALEALENEGLNPTCWAIVDEKAPLPEDKLGDTDETP